MRTLIPYAAPPGPQCRAALSTLQLPQLYALLQLLTPTHAVKGNADQLTPLHETLLGNAMGLQAPDGLLPWAALDAQRLGLTGLHGHTGWAWITPCHWTLQSNHVTMDDPLQLSLTSQDADLLWRAMHPYFLEDGITLFVHPLGHASTRWLAHGAVLTDLPTASLDRVAAQMVDPWTPRQPQAQVLRRLQNEMQMLLYTHPVNDARARFKLPSVNSFWVSGTGTLPEAGATLSPAQDGCHVLDSLRAPALRDDASAWTQAWQSLDSTGIAPLLAAARRGEPVDLTLCGEAQALTFELQALGLVQKVQRRWKPVQTAALLETL